jgi:hypothetical protein
MRLRAVLLLALFLGAGTSVPSLDALLYHRHAERFAGDAHFDPAGGCGGHADHCTLGRTPPGSRSDQPRCTEIRLPERESHALVGPLASRPVVHPRGTLPPTRAPPAASV